jgi:hypothetical protein
VPFLEPSTKCVDGAREGDLGNPCTWYLVLVPWYHLIIHPVHVIHCIPRITAVLQCESATGSMNFRYSMRYAGIGHSTTTYECIMRMWTNLTYWRMVIQGTTSVQFHLSMRIFSKGSHPVSFRSFSCRLRYIVHDDDGLRVLLSASERGIIILSSKLYDAYVFAREV